MELHKVVFEEVEVNRRLRELGLTQGILRDSVEKGQAAWNSCTANDPPVLAGILGWGRTVRSLRETLAMRGWRNSDDGNFSTVVNRPGSLAIAVATGDERTGRSSGTPRTKYPRGPATESAIEQNRAQLEFDLPEFRKESDSPAVAGLTTYLLLMARSANEVRCELSLPADIDKDGWILAWAERIILEPVSLNPETEIEPAHEESPVVVEVSRKA